MMFRRNRMYTALLIPAVLSTGAFAQTPSLNVGDIAPPLSITEWVKGKPIKLSKDASKKIHVIEFWATWCPPCKMSVPLLTDLQRKYRKDVVIVGVTEPDARGNSPSAIRRFVREKGDAMDYSVAIDDGKTSRDYMMAAMVMGIPHAFVINKERRIVWQGSPLDPALDSVLAGVVSGSYDIKAAMLEKEVAKKLEELNFRAQLGQWSAVWDGLIEIIKLDPANIVAMGALQSISSEELNNDKAFEKWVRSHLSKYRNNAVAMRNLAEMLCSIGDFQHRKPHLALQAAKAAYESDSKRDAWTLVTYARAHYQVGKLDRAVSLQQDAVALANDEDRSMLRSVLTYYRTCHDIQKSEN